MDGELLGLRDAVVTRDVRPDCIATQQPCLQSPCVIDAQCVDDGLGGFRCVCDHSDCYRPRPAAVSPATPAGADGQWPAAWDDLVRVNDLVVREGARAALTTANIALSVSPGEQVGDGDELIVFR